MTNDMTYVTRALQCKMLYFLNYFSALKTGDPMTLVWTERMSTGVRRLDAQHKQLIQKFNELTKVLENGQDIEGREAANDVLDFLMFYAKWHFSEEEKCMEACRCPVSRENKNAHRDFMVRFGKLHNDWHDEVIDIKTARVLHGELSAWIMNHIMHIDTQLRASMDQSEQR